MKRNEKPNSNKHFAAISTFQIAIAYLKIDTTTKMWRKTKSRAKEESETRTKDTIAV
jgi:hypothetical protein